jgi:hypothetical protein
MLALLLPVPGYDWPTLLLSLLSDLFSSGFGLLLLSRGKRGFDLRR